MTSPSCCLFIIDTFKMEGGQVLFSLQTLYFVVRVLKMSQTDLVVIWWTDRPQHKDLLRFP